MLTLFGCAPREMRRVRHMEIRNIDLAKVPDGAHVGTFTYSDFKYKVKTLVKFRKILHIQVLQNRDTKYAKRAEGVIPRIIKRQTPNVDVVSGATTTSKVLMKAVENSLKQ